MARKKGNPLSGKFRDPPQDGNASVPEQAEQDTDQIKLNDQGEVPAEPAEAPAEPAPADIPAPEQADQGDAPTEPAEAPADPVPADGPTPEQADQGDAPAEPAEAPADPVPVDAPAPEQADQGDAPAEPAEAPADPVPADAPAQHKENSEVPESPILSAAQVGEPGLVTDVLEVSDIYPFEGFGGIEAYAFQQDDEDIWKLVESVKQNGILEPVTVAPRPAGGYEMINGHRRLRACQLADIKTIPAVIVRDLNRDEVIKLYSPSVYKDAPEQTDKGNVPDRSPEVPAEPMATDKSAPEQADQDDIPAEPTEAPADPVAADAPAPEQADQGETPAEPAEAPADPAPADAPSPEHPEARFVKLAEIVPLPGTYVKDTPREDYTELLDSIKANGLEKPIILRKGEKGDFQLVDGFHRCEAMKQAGMLEVPAEVYEMPLAEASRYRKGHRTDPDLPIPGTLIPAHPPREGPNADMDAPAQDEEEFVVPKDFKVTIAKEGQSELVRLLESSTLLTTSAKPGTAGESGVKNGKRPEKAGL